MRVIHYIASFFPHARGATHSAMLLARQLRTRGVDVEFIVEDMGPEWRAGGMYDEFPVQSMTLTHPGKWSKVKGFFKLYRYLRSHRGKVGVFHVHAAPYMNLLLALLAGRWAGCPSLVKITSDGWDTPDGVRHGKHGRLALALYRRIRGVVAMTSGQAQKCRDWRIPGEIMVIPNGVDTDVFHPAGSDEKRALRKQLGLPEDRLLLVYAGWLGHGKGTDVLFQVWQGLRPEFPNLDLLLVGNYMGMEVMASPIEGFLKQYNLPAEWSHDRGLHVIGKVKDIAPYLRAADLFVFPSRREGFGTVQVEAMACGLPCVVNDLPGVSSDIFPDNTHGVRIAGNAVNLFVRECSDILANPTRRAEMGARARAAAVENYSVNHVADQYIALYRKLIHDTAHRHPGPV